jgi:hypothetical protein
LANALENEKIIKEIDVDHTFYSELSNPTHFEREYYGNSNISETQQDATIEHPNASISIYFPTWKENIIETKHIQ